MYSVLFNMIKVFDDWLDLTFCASLDEYILMNTPHRYGQHANRDAEAQNTFYYSECSFDDFHIQYLREKIKECIGVGVEFIKVLTNIQYMGMDSAFHSDDGDMTAIYMVSPTLDNSGFFEYKNEGYRTINKVEFKQNRMIIHDDVEHRARSPETVRPRMTIAFQMKIN